MVATWVGGMLLSDFPRTGVKRIVYQSLVCFVLAIIIAFFAKRTLRSSPASTVKP
jgi:predicted MFS family arabinose efflux permease